MIALQTMLITLNFICFIWTRNLLILISDRSVYQQSSAFKMSDASNLHMQYHNSANKITIYCVDITVHVVSGQDWAPLLERRET